MAHKKGLGSSKNGRDSNPKYLGVKMFDGQVAQPGNIIVRQRGTRFRPGPGTEIGRDDTIFAVRPGTVSFRTSGERRFVSVVESQTLAGPRPADDVGAGPRGVWRGRLRQCLRAARLGTRSHTLVTSFGDGTWPPQPCDTREPALRFPHDVQRPRDGSRSGRQGRRRRAQLPPREVRPEGRAGRR